MTVNYYDANLCHNVLTCRSGTGFLLFITKTLKHWHVKKQAIVETCTHGSEHSSARTYAENVLDLQATLRYLGEPILSLSHMVGDDIIVVDSSVTPNVNIHKLHIALLFY